MAKTHKIKLTRDALNVLQNHLLGQYPAEKEIDWNRKHAIYDITLETELERADKLKKIEDEANVKLKEINTSNTTEAEKKVEIKKLETEIRTQIRDIDLEEVEIELPNRAYTYFKDNFADVLNIYLKKWNEARKQQFMDKERKISDVQAFRQDIIAERAIYKRVKEIQKAFDIEEEKDEEEK